MRNAPPATRIQNSKPRNSSKQPKMTPRNPTPKSLIENSKILKKSLKYNFRVFSDAFQYFLNFLKYFGVVPWGSKVSFFGGSQKGGFQKGGFGGCSPGTKTGTRVRSPKPPFWKPPFYLPMTLFGVDKRVVSKRVVLADVPPERKPERGHVRQNHPSTKPPFYLPMTLFGRGISGLGVLNPCVAGRVFLNTKLATL